MPSWWHRVNSSSGFCGRETACILTNEIEVFLASVHREIPNARRFLARNNQMAEEELRARLKDTFGLPNVVIDELLSTNTNK